MQWPGNVVAYKLKDMKKVLLSLFLLSPFLMFGQYELDSTLMEDAFLQRAVNGKHKCCLTSLFYEEQESYGMNGSSMECYLFQVQVQDSLRVKFSTSELFKIARYSKMPFFRLAAFEVFAESDYIIGSVVSFFEKEFLCLDCPEWFMYSNLPGATPKIYYPVPNSLQPSPKCINIKMLEMVTPNTKGHTKCKKLPLETVTTLRTLVMCNFYPTITEGIAFDKPPTFSITKPFIDFGTVDLNAYSGSSDFELRSKFKVRNNTNKTITISTKASSHTACESYRYSVPANTTIIIDFKSLIDVDLVDGKIDRKITIKNRENGEVMVFRFTANFVKRDS